MPFSITKTNHPSSSDTFVFSKTMHNIKDPKIGRNVGILSQKLALNAFLCGKYIWRVMAI